MSKPITDTLRMLQGGAFNVECGERLAEMVKGVDETGKAGRLTMTIDIKKVGGAVQVLARVTDKTPEESPDADMFWPTVEGNLSVNNPAQRELELREVKEPKSPPRDIDPESGEIRSAG